MLASLLNNVHTKLAFDLPTSSFPGFCLVYFQDTVSCLLSSTDATRLDGEIQAIMKVSATHTNPSPVFDANIIYKDDKIS